MLPLAVSGQWNVVNMAKFLKALSASKWEMAGIILMISGAECMRIAGIKAKELSDVWAEADKIAKNSSGESNG